MLDFSLLEAPLLIHQIMTFPLDDFLAFVGFLKRYGTPISSLMVYRAFRNRSET